ncbi:TVP38/TMEM64 family protein [Arenicella xantha]|uniref:TVP38/TMEM64 family membrane protein n=1 Tax=Arenicella xantha TaxID=644221 RepID=A0A395JMB5_9GAMM|nr:TVP38/TMEM64 family protein [Arenicella xantha]RBP52760.1 putative membrane protein YdjX (TVP38/TMEM64 family) [Arenicella xantha]
MNIKQLALVALIISIIACYFIFGGEELLSPNYYQAMYRDSPLTTALVFFAIYVVSTAISQPSSAILSIASGIIFGRVIGLPMALFACSLGGTLAFLSSRYLLHDFIEKRFSAPYQKVNRGVQKDGAFYVFSLRMVPVIPFWLLNLLMGLTKMDTKHFFFATLLGMLPITAILVHFGAELGAIENYTMSAIFKPKMIIALVLLALLPFVARWLLKQITSRYQAEHETSQ